MERVVVRARQSDVENVETAEASPLRHTLLINRLCPQSWTRQRVLVRYVQYSSYAFGRLHFQHILEV